MSSHLNKSKASGSVAGRQSSLLTFFQKKAGTVVAGSDRVSVDSEVAESPLAKGNEADAVGYSNSKTVVSPGSKENHAVADRGNDEIASKKRRPVPAIDDDDEDAVVESKPKRRRARLMDSSDDDNEELCASEDKEKPDCGEARAFPLTTSTPKVTKTVKKVDVSVAKTPASSKKLNASISDISRSYLGSFRSVDNTEETFDASTTLNLSTLNNTSRREADEVKAPLDPVQIFTHQQLEFLKPEKIRDADGRRPTDADYNPRTLKLPQEFLNKQTAGHRQWWTFKKHNYDVVLFFKVGKFYELYHQDAVIAVKELNLVFMKGDYAHCGFPEIAYGRFAEKLLRLGYRVARVEQTETPLQLEERAKMSAVKIDKVVRREICQITTPGTRTHSFIEVDSHLDGEQTDREEQRLDAPRLLMALCEEPGANESASYGVCFVDTSVGQFALGRFDDDYQRSLLRTLLAHHPPAQVLIERGKSSSTTRNVLRNSLAGVSVTESLASKSEFWTGQETLKVLAEKYYTAADMPDVLKGMVSRDDPLMRTPQPQHRLTLSALGAVLWYLGRCMIADDMLSMRNFALYASPGGGGLPERIGASVDKWWTGRRMVLDGVTLGNLNVVPSGADGQIEEDPSLFTTIDFCLTSFGKRLLRQWLCSPLCDPFEIQQRQEAVTALRNCDKDLQDKFAQLLKSLPVLDRLLQKIHTLGQKSRGVDGHPDGRAVMFEGDKYNRRKMCDLLSALDGFSACQRLATLYQKHFAADHSSALLDSVLSTSGFPDVTSTLASLKSAFDADTARRQGVVVPGRGADVDYDAACDAIDGVQQRLNAYLQQQKRQLNCSSIVFYGTGKNRYQLEIPEDVAKRVPSHFELKTQKKGFKRYMTPEIDTMFTSLQEKELEKETILKDIMRRVFANFDSKYRTWAVIVEKVAIFDVLFSLARYSQLNGVEMCQPTFVTDENEVTVNIENGYHPCLVGRFEAGRFIPNDTKIDQATGTVLLITGPNMGGKSTLMRQVSLLVILAQMGSYVPATKFHLSPVDRIFTRLGANDRLLAGESTFYVELSETKVILRDASRHSLVVLDELGRGTSTHDGTAIAYAVLKELASANGEDGAAGRQCRTLFSTHYHTLVDDFCSFPSVALKHMACLVETAGLDEHPTEESVTFLYKLTDGACPKSYGFYAAKLAGVPAEIIRESYEKSQQVQESYANKLKRLLSCLEKLTHCDDDVELVKQIQKLQSV